MAIKVLIVDDSAFMRKILEGIFKEIDGVDVLEVARNGQDALKIMEKMKPELITLDIEMPGMDGITTLKHMKKEFDIPVVMLSAKGDKKTTIQALEFGAVDFIEKPVNIKENCEDFKCNLKKK